MKSLLHLLVLLCSLTQVSAQITISGLVTDKRSGIPLPGTNVVVMSENIGVTSDSEGRYEIKLTKPGSYTVKYSFVGYQTQSYVLDLSNETTVKNIEFETAFVLNSEIVIAATRVASEAGIAHSTIEKNVLDDVNTGRDIPFMLESVPSLIATSDAGTGIGYTGVRIRGSDASRINVTIDGIPINDAESQLLYWVNMPDLASSVNSVQVQRGAGTSTNGAGAFGGSINIQTSTPADSAFVNSLNSAGSFNTWRNTISFGSGMLKNKWNFNGRLSRITSDGYVDRATSDLKSFFVSGGYFSERMMLKFNVFSGKEITYQSWYGIPEASLDTNRTWNYYNYENQVDDYQQDHYQAFFSYDFKKNLILNTAFHYTRGSGFYEEFKEDELLADYNLPDFILNGDTIVSSDVVRRKWLDNDFYGAVASLHFNPSSVLGFILGGSYNEYDGDHFGEVIRSEFSAPVLTPHRYYFNNGLKKDFTVYGKSTWMVNQKFQLLVDLQIRNISYSFEGLDDLGQPLPQNDKLLFFNPKLSINYQFNAANQIYFFSGIANKEPSRDDYTESTTNSRPLHESMYDFEAGYRYKSSKLIIGVNYYLMLYDNQLVLTGKLNDVGNYTRVNIASSFREGIETESTWLPFNKLQCTSNVTLSRNKIKNFKEYIDDYDNGGQLIRVYSETDISFSPAVTGYLGAIYKPGKSWEISLSNKYVGKQFLDNTSDSKRSLDPYYLSDFRISWKWNPGFVREVSLSAMVNNVFDHQYESNGYTFSYLYSGELTTENYYYPQAGRNYMIGINVSF
ncbi:MAG: TonB-dependent receptor [Bacteroidetes bacterium]|nr:TonB-dependent receptor [Bacteroidota bacterium]